MLVDVFDDKKSIFHFVVGFLTYFVPCLFVIFVIYEIVEHLILFKIESESKFIGDIFEFSFGCMTSLILLRGCFGC